MHSNLLLTTLFLFISNILFTINSQTLQHFNFISGTGNNATVIIQTSANPNLNGSPLVTGDEIAVYTPAGLCVGAVVWNNVNTSVTVWGDNAQTPQIDGIVVGQTMGFRVWDQSTNTEIEDVDVTYNQNPPFRTNGNYVVDGIYNLLTFESPLPVELTSFIASLRMNTVYLKWETATEVNNYGFEVERKTENDWKKFGFVYGNGTSNSPKSYSYIDDNVSSGNYSYRLKQIDNDGTFEYSNTIEVTINSPEKFALNQNFPNPFNPSTKISWQSTVSGYQSLKVYDVLGNEVATLVDEFRNAGSYNADFDGSNLSSGVYFYQLKTGEFLDSKKMTLLK